MNTSMRQTLVICISFLMSMILEILPLPHWALWFRPEWTFVLLLFWVIFTPHRVGIVTAFFIGIFMDCLMGTLLGQHALAFTVVTYLVIKFHSQLNNAPLLQQLGMLLMLVLLELALQYWIMELVGLPLGHGSYWFPVLTTVMVWPWLCALSHRSGDIYLKFML